MKKDDFITVHVPQSGAFRLVDEATLDKILATSQWFHILKIPPTGLEALGFALRFFRVTLDLSINELSQKSGIHRNQLTHIEKATLKKKPHAGTLHKLSEILGEDFRTVVKAQGYL